MDKKNTIIILSCAVILLIAIIFFQLNAGVFSIPRFDKNLVRLEKQSSSTEVSDIEADLNQTDLSNIDSELNDIEKELTNF